MFMFIKYLLFSSNKIFYFVFSFFLFFIQSGGWMLTVLKISSFLIMVKLYLKRLANLSRIMFQTWQPQCNIMDSSTCSKQLLIQKKPKHTVTGISWILSLPPDLHNSLNGIFSRVDLVIKIDTAIRWEFESPCKDIFRNCFTLHRGDMVTFQGRI